MRSGFRTARGLLIVLFATCGFFLSFAAMADAANSLRIELRPLAQEQDPNETSENKKWDVSNPPGPADIVQVDSREGTWMSLDVSPDGSDIIFDLLGDIYRIPITGGEAQALTEGVPWDMQPRYSPDGRYIALTSDRGGGDNIWIMDRDGSSPRQATKEDFRLLNSPVRTPDGRIHFPRRLARRTSGVGRQWYRHRI